MSTLATAVRRFIRNEDAASMAEYAVLVAVIVAAVAIAATTIGNGIKAKASATSTAIGSA
jgi:Flp pilus assembly pilin Flp